MTRPAIFRSRGFRRSCSHNCENANSFHAVRKSLVGLTVGIPYQEFPWFDVRKDSPQLLGGPFRSGIIGQVAEDDSSPVEEVKVLLGQAVLGVSVNPVEEVARFSLTKIPMVNPALRAALPPSGFLDRRFSGASRGDTDLTPFWVLRFPKNAEGAFRAPSFCSEGWNF